MAIDGESTHKIVVLIDADNAQVGKLRAIMAEIATHGHIVVKRAYGDWSSDYLKNWKEQLNFFAVQPVQQFSYTTGKNSTDIVMVIDAMDLLYKEKYDTFVLVSSDSDFTSLATRLKSSEIYVYGIGEKKTPIAFRNACDNFIFTENLDVQKSQSVEDCVGQHIISEEQPVENNNSSINTAATETEKNIDDISVNENRLQQDNVSQSIDEVVPLLNIACETYGDEGGWTNVSSAGTYIKRTMPDFDAKNYGFPKLPELIKSLDALYEMKKYKGKGSVNIIAYRRIS